MHTRSTPSAATLERAVAQQEIWPAFQPLVDFNTRDLMGFEVLARWTDQALGTISPADFIPLAERTGQIDEITRYIIRHACEKARHWPGNFFLAFNVSPVQFGNPQLDRLILDEVRDAGFPAERICIEITEGAVIEDDVVAERTVHRLKEAGVTLALDDFGTGYGSLCRLHALPFDKLKIDRKFINSIETSPMSLKIVSSVIGLGLSLGLDVVAEGVENERQVEILRKLGCTTAQGWAFSRPLVSEDAEALLVRQVWPAKPPAQLDNSAFQKTHQLDGLYDGAPIGLCFINPSHAHVSVNAKFADMMGLQVSEMVGRTVYDFFPAAMADEITIIINRVLKGETVQLEEFRVPSSGRVLFIINRLVEDEHGVPLGLSVSAVDVTEKKSLEGALRELEDLAQASFELFPSVAWMANAQGEITYIGCALDGPRKGLSERLEEWRRQVHPDDRERVTREWLACVRHKGEFLSRFRVNRHEAGFRWMQSKARPTTDSSEHFVGWVGVIADIHDQHLLEARISELERLELQGAANGF